MRCAVSRCKKAARHPAGLCMSCWANLPADERLSITALAAGAKNGGVERQKFQLAQGRLVLRLNGDNPSLKP